MVTFTSNRGGSSCYPCNSICVGTETKISYGCWFRSSHVRCVGSLANAYGETISHWWHCYGILVWSSFFFGRKVADCHLKTKIFSEFFGCLEDDQCLFILVPFSGDITFIFFLAGWITSFFFCKTSCMELTRIKTVDEIYPWEKLDDSSSESVFLCQQLRLMTSIRDFVDERHSNFYSNTLFFSSNLWGISSNRDLFRLERCFFFCRSFVAGEELGQPTKASFFQKWLRERLLRYFSFQAIFEDDPHRFPILFATVSEAKHVENGRLKRYCCKGLNIHIFIRLMVQKSGERSPPGYDAFNYNIMG